MAMLEYFRSPDGLSDHGLHLIPSASQLRPAPGKELTIHAYESPVNLFEP